MRAVKDQRLELWGGVECTVNRVGDAFHNQLRASGHDWRIGDLDRFAHLGLRRLRYPVLWELTAPHQPDVRDWRWSDERLARLQALAIEPIVGLLHHGSGPRYTHLLDPAFPDLFAAYAGAVAERYPWVQSYTPINEPLTTARFSALYGHWYPHARDDRSFIRAVLNQCRATIQAMQAIRQVNPAALLIQTDDLGRVSSTPRLAYQAAFDNERRWLGWDLLCGRIDAEHPIYAYLTGFGASEEELAWFEEHSCPPDVIGVNHYITSDRYLDERLERFPPSTWGGNGRDEYADVETVRACADGAPGLANALREAWGRYGLPLAVTESHLGCTREEQLRWLQESWTAAEGVRAEGADVRALTVWALLGSFDWNSLVTRMAGHYEPGVFDVRGKQPRPTALAALISQITSGTGGSAAVLADAGWWRRTSRLFPSCATGQRSPAGLRNRRSNILVTGATGTLGRAFARICDARGLPARVCTRAELDICEEESITRALDSIRPWAVVNTAGYVRVDDAERDCERCYRENSTGPALLASACAVRGIPFLTFSTDLVFDGLRTTPYHERDAAAPLNVYGLSKMRAERAVVREHPDSLIVRTSSFFGPWDEHNFLAAALRSLRAGQTFRAIDDNVVSPTYVPDLVHASLDLLIDGERGLWHLVNQGSISWAELARFTAKLAGVSVERLEACGWRALGLPARRPPFSALTSERALIMPALDDAIERYVAASQV